MVIIGGWDDGVCDISNSLELILLSATVKVGTLGAFEGASSSSAVNDGGSVFSGDASLVNWGICSNSGASSSSRTSALQSVKYNCIGAFCNTQSRLKVATRRVK